MTPPWQQFRVGTPHPDPSLFNPDCVPFETISHVAHVPTAIRIVKEGKLKADLVFDASLLNRKRIRVVWLSPNDWHAGFRYGNVRLTFDWPALIAGKKIYWVETMEYSPLALRILITTEDHDDLIPYNPESGDGPWWFAPDGTHYWNGKYCLEIMYEGDIPMDDAKKVDFVNHHSIYCCIEPFACRFCGIDAGKGGAEFLAFLCSEQMTLSLPGLLEMDFGPPVASIAVRSALVEISSACDAILPTTWGTISRSDPRAIPIARALLRTFFVDSLTGDRDQLASFFQSKEELKNVVLKTINNAIGL